MAIGPGQLKANLSEEAYSFEPQIDALLKTEKMYGLSITIIPPRGMTVAHYHVLKESYIDAGWGDLSWRDDQRDGTSITFYQHKQTPPNGFSLSR